MGLLLVQPTTLVLHIGLFDVKFSADMHQHASQDDIFWER